jgi:hypothetical protein
VATQVYSSRFISRYVPGSSLTAFLCPAGYRAVLRSIYLLETSPGGGIFQAAAGAGIVFWTAGPNLTTTYNYYSWDGRLVFEAGEQLEISNDLAVSMYAGGYLLSLP